MAAKTWEADFRYRAIKASIRQLDGHDRNDLFSFPGSFCIPVAEKPVVGWTPGKLMLIALVVGFALLASGALLASRVEIKDDEADVGLLILGCVATLCGFVCFLAPVLLDRHVMRLLLGQRGSHLLAHEGTVLCAEISEADRSRLKISIDGDDYILLLADAQERRLLIEGVAARYQICGEDVQYVDEFEWLNYLGAEIEYRVDEDTTLRIAIARVSMLLELTRQLPFLLFLRKRIRNRILDVCRETLSPERTD